MATVHVHDFNQWLVTSQQWLCICGLSKNAADALKNQPPEAGRVQVSDSASTVSAPENK